MSARRDPCQGQFCPELGQSAFFNSSGLALPLSRGIPEQEGPTQTKQEASRTASCAAEVRSSHRGADAAKSGQRRASRGGKVGFLRPRALPPACHTVALEFTPLSTRSRCWHCLLSPPGRRQASRRYHPVPSPTTTSGPPNRSTNGWASASLFERTVSCVQRLQGDRGLPVEFVVGAAPGQSHP